MKKTLLHCLLALGILLTQAFAEEQPTFHEKSVTSGTVKLLRNGGYVLYMRHGNSDTSRPDRVPQVDLNDCSTQRPLTEEGREVAAQVGIAIRKLKIPVGEIYSSPMCRAKESAQAAFGNDITLDNNLMYTSNLTDEEKKPILQKTRELLSKPVTKGVNRVVVAHAPNLMDLMGYFPKPEATVVIFRPHEARGFEYLGSITPDQWQQFLK